MSETTEHTAATLKLMQVNGQLEARCERLEGALRIAVEELEFDHEHGVVGRTGERRLVDRALDLARKALSDTAQQETRKSEPMTVGDGGAALFAKIAEDAATEMRERAAKLLEDRAESFVSRRNPAQINKHCAALFRDQAERIRALPIDPETGGK